jgi:cadmium resistance protein CadD (predicted permease)
MSAKRQKSWQAKAGAYMGLVWVLPVSMAALWWIGDYLDGRMGTGYLAYVGLALGFIAGLYETIRQADRIENGSR